MITQTNRSRCESLYLYGLEAVKPERLMTNELIVNNEPKVTLRCRRGHKEYSLDRKFRVIGFGKAVVGMAASLAERFSEFILEGAVSVPLGLSQLASMKPLVAKCERHNIQVLEGAHNNLPDSASEAATNIIINMVKDLSKEDLVIVLISGGGSALLPSPLPPIRLEEKIDIIKRLSTSGASITELNTVRKQLSRVKGGGLARILHPAKVLSLILSDVMGDPLDVIASGPTVFCQPDVSAREVLNKYKILDGLPEHIRSMLEKDNVDVNQFEGDFPHVENVIVGNIDLALDSVCNGAEQMGLTSAILSNHVSGEAMEIGIAWAHLAKNILTNADSEASLAALNCSSPPSILSRLQQHGVLDLNGLALIGGGETTVTVRGGGKGGRNQEIVLAFGLEYDRIQHEGSTKVNDYSVEFLSCGTDGIDGPTDAAGAQFSRCIWQKGSLLKLDPATFLTNNNSYEFWSQVDGLIKTGHSGTNVMDIHILVIKKLGK